MLLNVSCTSCNHSYSINFSKSSINDVSCPYCSFKPSLTDLDYIYHIYDSFTSCQQRLRTINLIDMVTCNSNDPIVPSRSSVNTLLDNLSFFKHSFENGSHEMQQQILRIVDYLFLLSLRDIQNNNIESLEKLGNVLHKLHDNKCTSENNALIKLLLDSPDPQIDY